MDRRAFLALSSVAVTTLQGRAQPGAGAARPLLSFGLITDVQYADAEADGQRHYRASIPKLDAAAADLAELRLPFTLHLGDVIDRDFASFAGILPGFARLGHPVRHLLGNHDFSIADARKGQVATLLGMPADYYSFCASGVRFVMLDTNELSTYKHPRGSVAEREGGDALRVLAASGSAHAKPWNGGLARKQLAWLEDELAAADAAGQPVIVCSHHPLLPEEGHQAWNNREILAVIGRHPCVRACFAGHNHAGAESFHNGIPCITFKSLLHEPQTTAYAVLSLFADHLVIAGRGREVSREIPLRRDA